MADTQEQPSAVKASTATETKSQDAQPRGETSDTKSAEEEEHQGKENVEEEVDPEQAGEALFNLNIVLPHEPKKIGVVASSSEQVHELRQSIIELPTAFQYSCFHLEFNSERINDFIPLSDVKGLGQDSEIRLVEDPYTEKEARIHVIRIRDLIGAAGDRTDTVHGVLPGLTLFDEVSEHSEVGDHVTASSYDFSALANPTGTLLPRDEPPAPKTVKSVSLSPWNPPPYHLRQKGHLLYLIVTTNEGEQYQITSHVGGFYVNKSSNSKFDPSPKSAPKGHSAHSLLKLIEEVSPSFSKQFEELLQFSSRKDATATFQMTNAIPAAPWLVPTPNSTICQHSADITRTQEGYLIGGIDNTDALRDWNEEFQSARELPKETVQDRVFRERFVSKLFADYTDAAARGAILVARGEVTALNPTEGRNAQIFVYNNVFFSFGADGVGTFTAEGGDDAARVATGKDVHGVRLVNQFDIDGLYSPATVVVDYLGKRIVGQTVVPGIFKQRDPGENSIDYGAVEGKEIVAADERFIETFAKLSKFLKVKKHPVWDKDGKRFDLEGSVETKGLLGTDGRKYVLDLYRITPLDISWMEEVGAPSSEDEKPELPEYPHRMTVLRPELVDALRSVKWGDWVNVALAKRAKKSSDSKTEEKKVEGGEKELKDKEENPDGGEKKPEEEDETSEQETSKQSENDTKEKPDTDTGSSMGGGQLDPAEKDEDDETEQDDRLDTSEFYFALNPDVFSGQVPQTDAEKEELTADEKDVRDACAWLRESIIPEFVSDVKNSELPFPMDGQALTRMMHKRGINIRYISKVMAACEGPRLQRLADLCVQEIVVRSFKHAAAKYLRYLPMPLTSACVAHLLNCLLGTGINPKPVAEIDESLKALYPEADLAFASVTPESLQQEIEEQAARRFRYPLGSQWHANLKHLQVLRDVCLKLGLQLQANNYQFTGEESDSGTPKSAANGTNGVNGQSGVNGHQDGGKKKKKKSRDGSPVSGLPASALTTFTPDDLINVVPVIKDSAPKSAISEEALEGGRHSIMQGNKKIGQELLLESLTLHEQIYGILHPEVARAYSSLAQIYYQLDEKEAAVDLARKAIIVAERTIGVDSSETVLYYLNLSLYLHGAGNSKAALAFVKHALDLWKVVYGLDHPDSITTLNNAAVMLQHMQAFHESRFWFEEALSVCERVMGRGSLSAASILFQLAQALALDSEPKSALTRMKECYQIFRDQLGPENNNTKEAETWLEQLTQNAVAIAKRDKDVQARRLRAGIRFPAARNVSLGSQAATATGAAQRVGSTGRTPTAVDARSIDDLIKFIEGNDAQKKITNKKRPGRAGAKPRVGGVAT